VYSGADPIDYAGEVLKTDRYLGDGHMLRSIVDHCKTEYMVLTEWDCVVLDKDLISHSIEYMEIESVDILAPCLSRSSCGGNHYNNEPVLNSIGSFIVCTRDAADYVVGVLNRHHSVEVSFFELPARAGLRVEQNPFIDPINFKPGGDIKIIGSAVHPVKNLKSLGGKIE
jgi:hypothetical protein